VSSQSPDLPSSIKDIKNGLRRSGYRYLDAFQKVNALSNRIQVSEEALKQLGKIVDKVITTAETASRGDSAQRANASVVFRKLASEFKKVISDATLKDGTSLVDKDGLQELFASLGLDTAQASSLASVFSEFVTPGKNHKLADETVRGRRPIPVIHEETTTTTTAGDGTFASAVSFSAGSEIADGGIASADFNGDGILDVVLSSNAGGSELNVVLGNGDGTFQTPIVHTPGGSPYGVRTGDVDNDGKQDVIWADNLGHVNVALGDGAGNLAYQTQVTLDASVTYRAADKLVDVNNDGNLDIVALSTAGTLYSYLGDGAGSFASGVSLALGTNNVAGLATGDFNGDGNVDLAVTDSATNQVIIVTGNGDGTFTAGATYTTANPAHITTGDFNNDGKLDILTSGAGASPRLALGNGDGTFGAEADVTLCFFADEAYGADFNGDGNLDVYGQTLTGTAAIALGNGDGTFAAANTIATGYALKWAAPADYDNDGIIEVATGSNNSSSFFYLSQNESTTTTTEETVARAPTELSGLFDTARTLATKGDARLVLTDAKELKKQIQKNLKALSDVKEYLSNNLTLIRSTALGLLDIGDNLKSATSADDLAAELRQNILSNPAAARRTADTLDPLFAKSLLSTSST
jgi:hypothetical protein